MKKEAFLPIDKELHEIHSLLTRLMESPKGYKLTNKDLDALDTAEEKLNKARSALWLLIDDSSSRAAR